MREAGYGDLAVGLYGNARCLIPTAEVDSGYVAVNLARRREPDYSEVIGVGASQDDLPVGLQRQAGDRLPKTNLTADGLLATIAEGRVEFDLQSSG